MKIALCFIISYEHILKKEDIWREWIKQNEDIINVYFYYKNLNKIKSSWILKHTIPPNYIHETSYLHVIPAYVSVMSFAYNHDKQNKWFCLLTESCCPIISPKRFRYLFYENYNKSIMNWRKSWWNTKFHKRANLEYLPEELRLANDPWFVLKREHVNIVKNFNNNPKFINIFKIICSGGLANESLFAIILYIYKQLDEKNLIASVTHATDWNRMESSTSPHLFKYANEADIKFMDNIFKEHNYAIFIRKMDPEFPDEILKHYIYDENKEKDELLVLNEPLIFKYNRVLSYLIYSRYYLLVGFLFYFAYLFYSL
jgi:hypothetical protein